MNLLFDVQYKFHEKDNKIEMIFGGFTGSWTNSSSYLGWIGFVGQNRLTTSYNIQPGAPSTYHRRDQGGSTARFFGYAARNYI